jgi:ComF family protein
MAILYFMAVKITSLIEKMVGLVAPYSCFGCGSKDNILCFGCYASQVVRPESFCALCGGPSRDWQLCNACRLRSGLEHVWVGAEHAGLVQKVVQVYKFERARVAYVPLARLLIDSLPYGDWHLVPIPTASNHVRQRGYDQTLLLAEQVADIRQLPLLRPLRRVSNVRQVGANRAERLAQAEGVFQIVPRAEVKGKNIVLIDDVCTTGATLSAAARELRRAGASEVHAVVCAWQAPKQED